MTNADVQIQRIEHEKSQTLAELEYALRRQAGLQVVIPCYHTCFTIRTSLLTLLSAANGSMKLCFHQAIQHACCSPQAVL